MKKFIWLSIYVINLLVISCVYDKQKKKMDSIELSNGISIRCKSLTRGEYEALLTQIEISPIRRFKDIYDIDVHELKDHRVIVKEGDYYTLYFSVDDLDKVLLDASGHSLGSEILLNKNPYGSNFPSRVDALIMELLNSLNLQYQELDENLLIRVDVQIDELPDSESFKKEYLLHFIALVGEVLKRQHGASWYMELSTDGVTWNPYMKIEGHRLQFFTYLYEDIYLRDTTNGGGLNELYKTVADIIRFNFK